jgi:hypothetical protein
MATKKKTAADASALPTEYTIGGETYRLVGKSDWSIRQDDHAIAILAEFALDQAEGGGTRLRDIVRGLISSGLYRRMLGVALQPDGADPINVGEDALEENVKRFEALRASGSPTASQEIFAATMGVVASFFGSVTS